MNGPCLNPNCHSCGKPHPHCRCYMADGGEVVPPDDMPAEMHSGPEEVPAEDMPHAMTAKAGDEVPAEDMPSDGKYSTPEQQSIARAEQFYNGVGGFLTPLVETKLLGIKPEDIKGRAEAPENKDQNQLFKTAGTVLGLTSGVGEMALAGKAATALIPQAVRGAQYLRAGLQFALMDKSDDITNGIIGTGDPATPVAAGLLHTGFAFIMGAASQGLGNIVGGAVDSLKNQKMVQAATKFLAKMGAADDPINAIGSLIYGAREAYNKEGSLKEKAEKGFLSYEEWRYGYGQLLKKVGGSTYSNINKYVLDALTTALSKEAIDAVPAARNWAQKIANGMQELPPALDAIFKGTAASVTPEASHEVVKKIHEFIEAGGVDSEVQNEMHQMNQSTQGFAEGGTVQSNPQAEPDHFAIAFPTQNILLNQTKARVSQYLNSLRPLPNPSKAPYDEAPVETEKKRSYQSALRIAAAPMTILNEINKGTLTPETLGHFKSLYPEVHSFLSSKLVERISKSQLEGKKPSYAKRQSLSLFLGSNLDSSLTPMAIQAAQAVFAQKQPMQQMPVKNKKGTSSLGKVSHSYLTDDQAAERRQQSVKN